jgi:hypothetical protein
MRLRVEMSECSRLADTLTFGIIFDLQFVYDFDIGMQDLFYSFADQAMHDAVFSAP